MPTWTKEQSDAIYQSGTNIIVSAGAGSGKTAVLTARVIQKLKEGIHINELLILTFTKAAAGEMKERIRKNIKKYPELTQELELLDTAYITTFDSFALSVVKKYHYLLNLPSNPKISDENIIEMLRKDILREVLDSFYEKNDIKFERMIRAFCVKDDEEVYNNLLSMTKKIENNFTKKEYLQNYIDNFYKDEHIEKLLKEFENLIKRYQENVKKTLKEFSYIAPKDYYAKCLESLNGILNAQNIDELIMYRSCKLPSLPRNSEEEIKNAKENVNNALKELSKLTEYGNCDQLIDDLKRLKPTIETLIGIIQIYFEKFEKEKREKQIYDFNDIAFFALELLEKYEEVREELKNSFHEIMIDEYQDTNDIQEKFIREISQDNVYMVGDIKQSIYRFRNANPYIFKNKYDSYRIHDKGEKIDLLKNFRSRAEVLKNINLIFNLIMDDFLGGANYIEEHQMIFGNNSYIEKGSTKENYNMEIRTYSCPKGLEYTKEEIEIFTIGRDIQKKVSEGYLLYDKDKEELHPTTYQDCVILIDRTTSFSLYKKIFNYLKIPITLYKDEMLNDSTLLYIMKNIITLLLGYLKKEFNQQFIHAFTSIARSFLYEMTDEEIFEKITEHRWYQNEIYKSLKSTVESISFTSLKGIIEKIYQNTNMIEKLIKIGNIEENLTILENIKNIAENYGNEGHNIEEFQEYLKRITEEEFQIKYPIPSESANSVKIMTIHKSKGLEYPICYFAGLYKSFNISDIKERFLYDNKYGFLAPLNEEGIYTCFLKELIKDNYIKEEISEKIRLFYVAVTRAKEKMILVLPENIRTETSLNQNIKLKYRSFADFLYSIWQNLSAYQESIELDSLQLSKHYLIEQEETMVSEEKLERIEVHEMQYHSEKKEKKRFSKNNTSIISKEEKKNMEVGIKIHEYLEYIDFTNPNYDLIEEPFFKKKVQRFVESELIQKHLFGTFYKEYEFITQENETEFHGIIDLMIELPNKIIIVDYKLNNLVDQAYQKQLEGYKNFLQKKTKKEIETYLYSILNEKIEQIK